jgi:hypothetical protein
MGQFAEAVGLLNTELDIACKLGDVEAEAKARSNLGAAHLSMAQAEHAEHAERAEQAGPLAGVDQGSCQSRHAHLRCALDMLAASQALLGRTGSGLDQCLVLIHMGLARLHQVRSCRPGLC